MIIYLQRSVDLRWLFDPMLLFILRWSSYSYLPINHFCLFWFFDIVVLNGGHRKMCELVDRISPKFCEILTKIFPQWFDIQLLWSSRNNFVEIKVIKVTEYTSSDISVWFCHCINEQTANPREEVSGELDKKLVAIQVCWTSIV